MGIVPQQSAVTEAIVARVDSTAEVPITVGPPRTLLIPRDQVVVLKALYRLEDDRSIEDSIRVRFESRVEGVGPAPATVEMRDRPGLGDSVWGYLAQRHTFRRVGFHVIHFTVRVEQDARAWQDRTWERHVRAIEDGRVEVHVHEAIG